MVLMNLNFYDLRDSIRTEIIRRLELIEFFEQPFDGAWLMRALSFVGWKKEGILKSGIHNLEKWVNDYAGNTDRDIGPLCLSYCLSKSSESKKIIASKASPILRRLIKESSGKFKVLNDPDQFYCISCAEFIDKKVSTELLRISAAKATGRISRKTMFFAAVVQLGGEFSKLDDISEIDDIEDVIAASWYLKRNTEEEISVLWQKLEAFIPSIYIGSGPELCRLSNRSIALLSETVAKEITEPNPNMIFDLFPLSPEIRAISEMHFKKGLFVSAVFEATKKLNELIQNVSGYTKEEADLIQATMKKQPPIIKFNKYLSEGSGKNEQAGLTLISEGIFKGFRNPKGHKAEDHHLVKLSPFECLAQLITIDYIWKRVQKSEVDK